MEAGVKSQVICRNKLHKKKSVILAIHGLELMVFVVCNLGKA